MKGNQVQLLIDIIASDQRTKYKVKDVAPRVHIRTGLVLSIEVRTVHEFFFLATVGKTPQQIHRQICRKLDK